MQQTYNKLQAPAASHQTPLQDLEDGDHGQLATDVQMSMLVAHQQSSPQAAREGYLWSMCCTPLRPWFSPSSKFDAALTVYFCCVQHTSPTFAITK
jgi:hypothetical protein